MNAAKQCLMFRNFKRCKRMHQNLLFCSTHNRWLLRQTWKKVIVEIIVLGFFGTLIVDHFLPPSETEAAILRFSESNSKKLDKLSDDVEKIKRLLESHDPNAKRELATYVTARGLENKYNYGFALFYTDDRKTLYYVPKPNMTFDPANVKIVSLTNSTICIDLPRFYIKTNQLEIQNACFSRIADGSLSLGAIKDVEVVAERISSSSSGVVWVLGLRDLALQ